MKLVDPQLTNELESLARAQLLEQQDKFLERVDEIVYKVGSSRRYWVLGIDSLELQSPQVELDWSFLDALELESLTLYGSSSNIGRIATILGRAELLDWCYQLIQSRVREDLKIASSLRTWVLETEDTELKDWLEKIALEGKLL